MPLALLAFLSAMIAVLPMADVIPGTAVFVSAPAKARPHHRLVVFMLDGLGARRARERGSMPAMQARRNTSARGVAIASFPTITPQGLRSIFSGHRPLPQPEFVGGLDNAAEPDSVLKRATEAGLRVVVVGQFNWEPLFHGHAGAIKTIAYRGLSILYNHDGRVVQNDYDAQVLAAAAPWVEPGPSKWDLLVLHLFELDPIGHAVGTGDELYERQLRWVDRRVNELSVRLAAQAPTTFMLVADHGMSPTGTHGGMTPVERQVPFELWGADVKPGRLSTRPLYDAAPTITAILGVPPPASAEGLPAVEALELTPERRAGVWRDVLEQRAARWNAVRALMPWLRGDPAPVLRRAGALESAGRFDEAARLLERSVRELDRGLEDALPEKWLVRLVVVVWCLVLAASFSLAWPGGPRASRVAAAATVALMAAVAAPVWKPGIWAWSSGLAEACAAALLLVAISGGLGGAPALSAAGWTAWWTAMAAVCLPDVVDPNLWAGVVLAAALAARAIRRPSPALLAAAAALLAGALVRTPHPAPQISLARSLLPLPSVPATPAAACAALRALTTAALLVALARKLRSASRRQAALELCCAGLAPAAALALGNGGGREAWIIAASALSAGGALAWCRHETRGFCLSLSAAAFFGALAAPAEACALTLAVAVGWAAAPDEDAPPLLAGLTLAALALWAFTTSGGRLRYLAISVEEGHRAFGDRWFPHALVALLVLKYMAGAGAPLLPRLGARSFRSVASALPPFGALAAGFMTTLWWDRFMQGGNLKFTGQVAYVGLVSSVVLGWVIVGLWATARLRARADGRA